MFRMTCSSHHRMPLHGLLYQSNCVMSCASVTSPTACCVSGSGRPARRPASVSNILNRSTRSWPSTRESQRLFLRAFEQSHCVKLFCPMCRSGVVLLCLLHALQIRGRSLGCHLQAITHLGISISPKKEFNVGLRMSRRY